MTHYLWIIPADIALILAVGSKVRNEQEGHAEIANKIAAGVWMLFALVLVLNFR